MTEENIHNPVTKEAKCFLSDQEYCAFQKTVQRLKKFNNELLKNVKEKIAIRKSIDFKYGDVELPETSEIWYHSRCYSNVTSFDKRVLERKNHTIEIE